MSSYLVIARKWRPALFEEIVGQEHVTKTLRNAVSSGKTAQAYLFCGPRGVGKTTAARILAKSLNCAKGPTPVPCNVCDSCKSVASGSSVDVIEIDGASNNSVNDVRELRESVRYMPGQGKYKVYIVDEVHMLSTSAFNALLKTLEEPPAHAVFILATTESHKIPATIISRCQRFDFRRIPFKDIQSHLKKIVTAEGIGFEEDALYTLAREADGSLRDAQSLLEQVAAYSGESVTNAAVTEALGLLDRNILYDLSQYILASDGRGCLNIVEKIYVFGYDLKRACASLLEHVRDLTVLKAAGSESLKDLPDSDLARLTGLASGVGIERLQMIFSIISRGYEEIGRSSEPRYSFEMALLRAAHLEGLESIQSVLTRLADLKRGMETSQAAGFAERPPSALQSVAPAPSPLSTRLAPQAAQLAGTERQAVGRQSPQAAQAQPSTPEGLLAFIRGKKPSWSASLQDAVVTIVDNVVEISPVAGHYKFLENYADLLQSICSEYVGSNIKAVIKQVSAARKESPVDPVVKDALRILGGRVIEDRRR